MMHTTDLKPAPVLQQPNKMPPDQAASLTKLTAGESQSQASNPQRMMLRLQCPSGHEARGQWRLEYQA